MAHTALLAMTNTAALPTKSAGGAPDAGLGITPVWNPMVILAFFYAVLFLVFAAIVAFIFVRRRRRALALARAEDTTTTTTTASDPEKTQASVSGESDVSGDGDADKTVFIAQAGGAEECKDSRASDGTATATVAGSGTKRDAPGEYWTPPLRRSMPFSSRASTPMSLRYQCNASDLSIAQREMSQVLVWLPSFQSNACGAVGTGSGPGPAGAGAGEGEPASGKMSAGERARDQEGPGEQEQAQEEQKGSERQEREEEGTKEDSESGCGVAQ